MKADLCVRTRGYLPHVEGNGGTYFVTFRLADSLPQHVLAEMRSRANMIVHARATGRELLGIEKYTIRRIETMLDENCGNALLRNRHAAQIVHDVLLFGDGKRYKLSASCVMPNHVHAVFQPLAPCTLQAVVHDWKSISSRRIKRILKRNGVVWQREYYDRLLRNENEFRRAIAYVEANPAKAGLTDWPWVYASA